MFVHRNEPNRPHISSDTINVKERGAKSPETKSTGSAVLNWRNPRHQPQKLYRVPHPLLQQQTIPRPNRAISAAGEGGSRPNSKESQPLFSENGIFLQISDFFFIFGKLQQ
ncbi:hypothetical protein ACXYMP_03285 [Aliiroseovarius sp. CAU 1755]